MDAAAPSTCQAPGCSNPFARVLDARPYDGAQVWQVSGFTDAAGVPLGPDDAKYSASGWPVCDRHDYTSVAVLPDWWGRLTEDQKNRARSADYYASGVLPPDIAQGLMGSVVYTAWQQHPDTGEWSFLRAHSDVLAALDGKPRDEDRV